MMNTKSNFLICLESVTVTNTEKLKKIVDL